MSPLRVGVAVVGLFAASVLGPLGVAGQSPSEPANGFELGRAEEHDRSSYSGRTSHANHRTGSDQEAEQVESVEPRRWWTVWSRASDRNRLIGAMWTLHIHHLDEGWSNDGTVALIYRGMYAGTFQTTHGPRAYTVGFERSWLSQQWNRAGAMFGFRTGLVYGYDGRLGWLAEKYPVLPFAQPVIYAEVGPVAADFTYTWVVISLSAALRF
jgi:hypothetical protein